VTRGPIGVDLADPADIVAAQAAHTAIVTRATAAPALPLARPRPRSEIADFPASDPAGGPHPPRTGTYSRRIFGNFPAVTSKGAPTSCEGGRRSSLILVRRESHTRLDVLRLSPTRGALRYTFRERRHRLHTLRLSVSFRTCQI
jgi:hypothetical protein